MNNLFTTDFIKTAPISVAILDKNLCFTSYSKIWLKEFNIKEKNIVGKYYFDVIPNTPERLRRICKNGLKGKSSNVTGQKFIDLKGNIQWLKWKVDPWNDYEGNITGIIIFAEDITAINRKKELLKKAQDVSNIGGWELDLATNQLHWTEVTKKIHKVGKDYIPKIDEGLSFYKEGKQREKITKLVNECINKGKPYDIELQIITAKGDELWVRAKGEAEFHKGKCVRIFGTFQDIDQEKKNELIYKETAERLKIAAKGAHIGVWEYDIAEDSFLCNDQQYELYGIKKKDFEGSYKAWKSMIHPEDLEKTRIEEEMVLKGKKNYNLTFRVVWPDGTIRHMQSSAELFKDEEGKPVKMIGTNWDITPIIEANLKYTEVTDRLEVATNAAQIGIWEYDIADDNLVWNEQMYELYGIRKVDFSGVYDAWKACLHPEDREQAEKEATKAMLGKKDYENIFRVVWPNGKIKHIQTVGVVHWDKEGRPQKVIGTNWDITPIKEAQLKYKEVADRLEVATKAAKMGIWEYDFATDSHVWNKQVYELHGIKEEDFAGGYESWRSLIHPEDQERTKIEEEMVMNGEKDLNHDYRVVWPNGTIRHIHATAKLLRDEKGNPLKMMGTNMDITSIKEAQLKYKEIADRLNLATNAAQIGIWEYDIAEDHSAWDDQVYKLYGITKKDFHGGDEAWRAMLHPEDREKVRIEEEKVLKGEKDLNHIFRVVWPNGEIHHLQSAAILLRDEEGNPEKMIGTNWDITTIKEAEEELRKLLKVTNEQNNNLLNFAHIVSHNLRSHSSNLSMLSSFLINEKNEEERKKLITMIDEASSGLNETVQHLNEVVYVKTNVDGNMTSINLYTALKNVEKNISTLFKEKEVTCEINVAKSHNLKAVPAYLDSIFLNLFTNSIKYSAENRQPRILVSSEIEGNKVVVAFSDNGQGIDLDRHGRKIFGMYKTFHGNKDAKGIGLFITKNQIEAMNGKIEVESTVNVG
ncbi:MAG: PAS domain-containing protein, partial [Maribacter sp.]|nr:PAS domain-containing protein [Maribacter sp.]